jgi:putative tryptophan/tyrosine transport system substrate-binding protein
VKKTFLVFAFSAMLLALSLPAEGQQQAKIPRVGFLDPGHPGPGAAFRQGLSDLGYMDGRNIIVERRSWEGRPDWAPENISELVRLKVNVLVIPGSRIVEIARRATTTIPIIMVAGGDPVSSGLVASFSKPGGNITGLTIQHPELSGKSLELLKETVPRLSRVAVLQEAGGDPDASREMEVAARALRLKLQTLEVRGPTELDTAFQAATKGRAEALLVRESAMLSSHTERIVTFSVKSRLPALGQLGRSTEAGLLISYGPDLSDLFKRSATYVDKILKGSKPADLPVERPKKFELVINLKTAKQIGLTIPPNVLVRADKVIR